jgi:hypothetical protein
MKRVLTFLVLTYCLFSHTPVAQTTSSHKFKGFLGTYHPFKGTAYGGSGWKEGELIQNAFSFGQNAILVKGSHNGYTFSENVNHSCQEWDVNKVYGILLPPTEFGAVNQPKDSDLWKPFEKYPGMIQAAHRFSELSKRCPQISGVIIDDFFNDFPKDISLKDLRALKDALIGKRIDDYGTVDSSSPATTPDLKLYIVVYEHHLGLKVEPEALDLLDGVCFWMWKQSDHYKQFDDYLETINRTYPNKEVVAGVYVRHSREIPVVPSVHHIIERAIDQYAQGRINGLLIFSAIWLAREECKRERWDELALPQFLGRTYYPFLGEGSGRVVNAKTNKPIRNALVSVWRLVGGKQLLATRKLSDERGVYHFGGWAGNDKKERVAYEIRIESDSFKARTMRVQLRARQSIKFADARLKQ